MKNVKRKNDLILVAVVLALAAALWLGLKLAYSGGGKLSAVVTVEGQEYAVLPMDKNTTELIVNSEGCTNLLVIKDGQAYMSEADCSNQVCVDTGKIKQEGQLIVCLPHKVVVTIENR